MQTNLANHQSEPSIMQSAFFVNGQRMIVYTGFGAMRIRSFYCNENWEPYPQPFAESPFLDGTQEQYHREIRAMHKAESFVPEHSTAINSTT